MYKYDPAKLVEAFNKSGHTFRSIAEKIGSSHSTMHQILRRNSQPQVNTMVDLCNELGVSPRSLFAKDA